jgi:hypothetical protein
MCPEVYSFLFPEERRLQQLPPESSNQIPVGARSLQRIPEENIGVILTIYIISCDNNRAETEPSTVGVKMDLQNGLSNQKSEITLGSWVDSFIYFSI